MTTIFNDCWFLTGPTASGKTRIAMCLAERLNAELISMDSMAIYRGMDIGTAKPALDLRAKVPHHLIDILDPTDLYSVSDYVAAAAACVQEIRQRGREPLFVGGTPLYLKAMLRGMFDGPPADPEFRAEVVAEIERVGIQALHERLEQVDPLSAKKLHPNDVRRIIRALEVHRATGAPISHMQLQFDDGRAAAEVRVFVLSWPRTELHIRINDRVDHMFADGFVEEVRNLLDRYETLGKTARQAVGYAEVISHLSEHVGLEETVRATKTRTRQFAKRQDTWFRSLSECRFIGRHDSQSPESVAEQIAEMGT
jgi:tRNA dimethylallyltransferase